MNNFSADAIPPAIYRSCECDIHVGKEQAAPEKADQYRRWRAMQEQRQPKAN